MIEAQLAAPQRRAARAGQAYRAHAVLTNRCNLTCGHCYQAEHESRELSAAEWADVFGQMAGMGVLFLTLSGGEPLSRADFPEILAAARRLRFAVDVYSNGTMIDEARARALAEAGVLKVALSLHGAQPETHDAFVGRPGAFDRVQRAIGALEAAGVRVELKSTVTSVNCREQPAIAELAAAHPLVQLKRGYRLFPRDDGDRGPEDYRPEEAHEREVVRAEVAALPRERLAAQLAEAAQALAAAETEVVPCQAARTTFAVLANGDVTPCTQTPALTMGNVRQRPLADLWREAKAAARLRALTAAAFAREHAECGRCRYHKVCWRCPALSLEDSGSPAGWSEQVCRQTKVRWEELERRAAELGLASPFEGARG